MTDDDDGKYPHYNYHWTTFFSQNVTALIIMTP